MSLSVIMPKKICINVLAVPMEAGGGETNSNLPMLSFSSSHSLELFSLTGTCRVWLLCLSPSPPHYCMPVQTKDTQPQVLQLSLSSRKPACDWGSDISRATGKRRLGGLEGQGRQKKEESGMRVRPIGQTQKGWWEGGLGVSVNSQISTP